MRTASGDPLADAAHKATRSNQAYVPLAQRIFGNKDIWLKTRCSLATSLCFSRLRYGLDTWVRVTKPAVAKIHHARMRVLRKLVGDSRFDGSCLNDNEVLAQLDLVHSDLWMLSMRLRALHWQLYGDVPYALNGLRRQPDTPAAQQTSDDLVWASASHARSSKRLPGVD